MTSSYKDFEEVEFDGDEDAATMGAEPLDSFGDLNFDLDLIIDQITEIWQREENLTRMLPEGSSDLYLPVVGPLFEAGGNSFAGLESRVNENGEVEVIIAGSGNDNYEELNRQASSFKDEGLFLNDEILNSDFQEGVSLAVDDEEGYIVDLNVDSLNYEDEDQDQDQDQDQDEDDQDDPDEDDSDGTPYLDAEEDLALDVEPGEDNEPVSRDVYKATFSPRVQPDFPVLSAALPEVLKSSEESKSDSSIPVVPVTSISEKFAKSVEAGLPHGMLPSMPVDIPMRDIQFVYAPDGSPDMLQTCLPYFETGETKLVNYLSKTTGAFAPGEAKFLRGIFDCVLFCCLVCRRIPQGLQIEFRAFRSTLEVFGRQLADLTEELKANGVAQQEIGQKWNQAVSSLSAYEKQVAVARSAQDKSLRSQMDLTKTLSQDLKRASKLNSSKSGGVPKWFFYLVPGMLTVSLLASAMLFLSSAGARQPVASSLPEGVVSKLVLSETGKSYIILLDRNGSPLPAVRSGTNTVFVVP